MTTSIIIPVHNRWDLTDECLRSVFAHTSGAFEVIVVDDASTDQTPLELARHPVRVLRNDERRAYSFNNNQAARVARGTHLCLLNNDTVVTPGWLEGMLEVAAREADIGVVGNKHLFPGTGLLHHCGMAVTTDGRPLHLHPHSDPALPAVNYERDLDMVSFACCLIPRDWYLELGGLDESYRNGYEDCDFCLRTKAAGRRVVYTPASVILHHGQQTPGRTDTDGVNAARFTATWGATMPRTLERIAEADRRHDAAMAAVPRSAPRGAQGIHLAIDFSQGNALTWVAAELAVALADAGRPVSIPCTAQLSPLLEPRLATRLASLMHDTPHRSFHVRFSHYWPHLFRQETHGEVDAELFVTNYRFRGATAPLDPWSRNLVSNAARKLALSTFSRQSLADLGVPDSRSAVVPPGYSPEIEELFATPRSRSDRAVRRLLVVTNSHDLNRYGTDLLVPALARAFHRHDPVEIHIKDYGTASGTTALRDLVAAHPGLPPVVWHTTFLSKHDLIRLYGEMDLLVCPFRGEGYAMKILDAMAIGLPVMMPAFGGPLEYAPAGGFLPLEYDEVPLGRCYDTEHHLVGPGAYWCEPRQASLVEALVRYARDPAAAEAAGAVARGHVFGRFTWKNAALAMAVALDGWFAEKERRVSRRRRPASLPTSVVIPTKDRPEELTATLRGYARQTEDDFEIVLVNDHGDLEAVRAAAAPFARRLRLRVIDNRGNPGPGAARNLGLELADGDVLLVTGDDIVPSSSLVARHRQAHARHPERETAFVGFVDWHPSLKIDWLARHIVGDGGQQFNFRDMAHGQIVPHDRFFTSNVSWKRGFTADLEQIFAETFRLAAFEDIELGHRLARRGMRLRYLADAVGHHLHAMTVRSFLARMRNVGGMCTVFAGTSPGAMPEEHLRLFDELERERRRRAHAGSDDGVSSAEMTLEPIIAALERLVADEGVQRNLEPLCRTLFDNLCRTFWRIGQAEEWARGSLATEWVAEWVVAQDVASLRSPRAQPAAPVATPSHRFSTRIRDWSMRYDAAVRLRSWLRDRRRVRRLARAVKGRSLDPS
ncbi:MAG: glycosyltransferase [Planctomycetia bacterium]|nr:glycosyltransferase [Planctomycetia bacterium]